MDYHQAQRIAATATSEQKNAFSVIAGQHAKRFIIMAYTKGYEAGASGKDLDTTRFFELLEEIIDIPEW